MITEDCISFETAKLLKEKGFDEPTTKSYYTEGLENPMIFSHDLLPCIRPDEFLCPTLQMVMKWFRKKHQIGIFPSQYHIYKDNTVSDEFGYGVEIIKLGTDIPLNPNGEKISDKDRYFTSTSYEQACEAAIKYCLEKLI